MPQLSLYLDDETHRELEKRSNISKVSISKFVAKILKTHLSVGWPDGYFSLFGSITDESFDKQEVSDWSSDTPRMSL
jgi:hypothetical protein